MHTELSHLRARRRSLIASLDHAIEATAWHAEHAEDGITVASGRPVYVPSGAPHASEGFLIASEVSDASLPHALHYFHDACHFADTANAMTSASQIVEVLTPALDGYEAVVRTGFALPWPLQDREFLHYVTTHRSVDAAGRPQAHIAYATVDRPDLAPWPGARRCAMRPSGQRITDLGDGRLRIVHCMTYDLGGAIGTWVQNTAFHAGHVKAYFDEWAAAMDVLRTETRRPAERTTRASGPTRHERAAA